MLVVFEYLIALPNFKIVRLIWIFCWLFFFDEELMCFDPRIDFFFFTSSVLFYIENWDYKCTWFLDVLSLWRNFKIARLVSVIQFRFCFSEEELMLFDLCVGCVDFRSVLLAFHFALKIEILCARCFCMFYFRWEFQNCEVSFSLRFALPTNNWCVSIFMYTVLIFIFHCMHFTLKIVILCARCGKKQIL